MPWRLAMAKTSACSHLWIGRYTQRPGLPSASSSNSGRFLRAGDSSARTPCQLMTLSYSSRSGSIICSFIGMCFRSNVQKRAQVDGNRPFHKHRSRKGIPVGCSTSSARETVVSACSTVRPHSSTSETGHFFSINNRLFAMRFEKSALTRLIVPSLLSR